MSGGASFQKSGARPVVVLSRDAAREDSKVGGTRHCAHHAVVAVGPISIAYQCSVLEVELSALVSRRDTCGLCQTRSSDSAQSQAEHQVIVFPEDDYQPWHQGRDEQGQGEDLDQLPAFNSREVARAATWTAALHEAGPFVRGCGDTSSGGGSPRHELRRRGIDRLAAAPRGSSQLSRSAGDRGRSDQVQLDVGARVGRNGLSDRS